MKKINLNLWVILLLSALIFSCEDDDSDPPLNTNIIDASGGTVTSLNNDLTINIPPGALTVATEITITETTAHPSGNIGVVYDLGPDGTRFNSPVTLTFDYNPSDLPTGSNQDDLAIAFAENGNWVLLNNNVVDNANNLVSATTDHFTPFGVIITTDDSSEGEPPSQLFYNPDNYPFVPNQTYQTPGASFSATGIPVFSIARVDPDFTSENFNINQENGQVTFSGLTNDASEIKLDISISNEFGTLATEEALTFHLASLSYTLDKEVFFPGSVFDSGLPETENIPESYEYYLTNLPSELEDSELAMNTQTGQISGNLSESIAVGTYQLEVTSANRDNWSLPFPNIITFEVVAPPSGLLYSPENTALIAGDMFDSGVPTIDGTGPFTFELGDIDDGLGASEFSMNSQTGQFTGAISGDAIPGSYSFNVSVSNSGGEVEFEEAVSLTIEEADVMLPGNVSYDVTGEFFIYTGAPTAQINIVEGSNNQLEYTFDVFPSITTGITLDENGNIIINDGLINANGPGYYAVSVTVSNGNEDATFEEVVIIRAFNPQGYILEYNPRSSLISAFNPEVLSATSNALFEPPNAPTFTIEKVYDQLGDDRTAELTQQEIITIASDGDLTFTVASPNDPIIADNFYRYFVDVRIAGSSGDVVYRAVAVFGPE